MMTLQKPFSPQLLEERFPIMGSMGDSAEFAQHYSHILRSSAVSAREENPTKK